MAKLNDIKSYIHSLNEQYITDGSSALAVAVEEPVANENTSIKVDVKNHIEPPPRPIIKNPFFEEKAEKNVTNNRKSDIIKNLVFGEDYGAIPMVKGNVLFKKGALKIIKLLEFLEAKENDGWGKSSIHNAYKTMNKYLNFAVDQEFIEKNPLGRLKFNSCSKQPKPKKHDGLETVIENFYNRIFKFGNTPTTVKFKVMLLLCADGCLRRTELMGLTVDKINLVDGYMEVEQNLYQLTRKEAIKIKVNRKGYTTTKTESSTRKLPLSAVTVQYLELYLSQCEKYLAKNRLTNKNKYLFYSTRNIPNRKRNGERLKDAPLVDVKVSDMSMLNSSLRRYCIEFGYKPFTSHKIRKWSYTERLNLDVQIEYADYVLGHSMGKSDSVYVLSNLYRGAKKQHFKWEDYLNSVISDDLY